MHCSESDQIRRSSPSSNVSESTGGHQPRSQARADGDRNAPSPNSGTSSKLRPFTRTLARAFSKLLWKARWTKPWWKAQSNLVDMRQQNILVDRIAAGPRISSKAANAEDEKFDLILIQSLTASMDTRWTSSLAAAVESTTALPISRSRR